MMEEVRRLNREYGFNLSEDEIKLVAGQAEEAERLFQTLHELDLTHVMPILKIDNEKVKK
jgi:Asp-tRNA(Asn)/Glu-tRNA(Gln) amidotransferase C subunit